MDKILQRSFLNAFGTVAYVAIVATIMQNGDRIFGEMNETVGPIAFLSLFVLSATITGSLVVGKPLLMYLNGEKSGAVKMFLYTIGWLALATALLLVIGVRY